MGQNTEESKIIQENITELKRLVKKGQPLVKANKDREIRATIREMQALYSAPPFNHVWTTFKLWAGLTINRWRSNINLRFNRVFKRI